MNVNPVVQVFSNELLVSHVLKSFSYKRVLQFERIASFTQHATSIYWLNVGLKERLSFSWTADSSSSRERYLLGKILHQYVETLPTIALESYREMVDPFPDFKAFLCSEYEELCKSPSDVAGSYLLKGLALVLNLKNNFPEELVELVKTNIFEAINLGASCASYLACMVVLKKFEVKELSLNAQKVILAFAQRSAEKYGDFKALYFLLEHDPLFEELFDEEETQSPALIAFLAWFMCQKQDYESSAVYYDRAVKAYGNQVSLSILRKAAETNLLIGEWEAAVAYIDQISMKGCEMTSEDLLYKGIALIKMKRLQDAEEILCGILEKYGFGVCGDVYEWLGRIMWETNRFADASIFYERAISVYGKDVPFEVLIHAGEVKLYVGEIVAAKSYYERAICNYKNQIFATVWANAGMVYSKLESWRKAYFCFLQVRKQDRILFGDSLSLRELAEEAKKNVVLQNQVIEKYDLRLPKDLYTKWT